MKVGMNMLLWATHVTEEHYAIIASGRERSGKPISGFDALIAAVCRSHGAALATRNFSDFDGTGVEIVDPWAPAGA